MPYPKNEVLANIFCCHDFSTRFLVIEPRHTKHKAVSLQRGAIGNRGGDVGAHLGDRDGIGKKETREVVFDGDT
jgi:hypothetical protein